MNRNYRIEHDTQSIILSKRFAREANAIGSAAYALLATLHRDFPDYAIKTNDINYKEAKRDFAKLTYDAMLRHIRFVDGASSPNYITLEGMIANKTCRGSYPTIKKWFLTNYPNYDEAI